MNKPFQKPALLIISLSLLSPAAAHAFFKLEWPRNPLPPIQMPPNPLPPIRLPDVKVHDALKNSVDNFLEVAKDAGKNVDEAVQHNMTELIDIMPPSFGRNSDKRDADRQKKKEEDLRKEREHAEEIKRTKSESLTRYINLLEGVTRDFAQLDSDMAEMNSEFKSIVDRALTGFNQRSFIKNSLIPSIRSHWSGEAAYSARLLALLEESNRDLDELTLKMALEDAKAKEAPEIASRETSRETARSVARSQNAVNRLRQLAKAHGEDMEMMLRRAVQYLDENDAGKTANLLAHNDQLLGKVHEFVKTRQSYYEGELKSARAELAKLQ